jgi:O-antigen/teichoic acid export membrane protein
MVDSFYEKRPGGLLPARRQQNRSQHGDLLGTDRLDEETTSLSGSALSGVAWNYTGTAVLVVAQIASTAATARLILPAEFGAYAAAQAAIGLAGYFTIATISFGILRRSELGVKTVGSALVISAGAGTLVLAALWFLAVPWADAWGIHSAVSLVRVLAFSLFFNSLASVPVALILRRLRFRAAALAETGAQVGGLTFSVLLAALLHSALALATGQVIAAFTLFIWTVVLARRDISFGYDRAEGRELFTYGSQLSVLYFGSYAANTLPSWIAGRTFGAFTLGLYSRASALANLPLTYLSAGVTKVLFPLYGRVRDDAARTKALLSEAIVLATGLTWPLFAICAGAAPVIVDVLLGARWHAATPLLQLSVLIACGAFPTGLLTNAAEALGWIRFATLRLIVFLFLLGVAVAIVESIGLGLSELLVGVAIAQWTTYGITLKPFGSRGFIDSRLLLRSHFIHALVSIAVFGIALACAHFLAGMGIVAQIAGELVLTASVCGVILAGRSWYPASEVLWRRLGPRAFERWLPSRFRTVAS